MAIGPSVLLYLVARNGSVENIRKTFAHTTVVYRAGAAFYGLGSLFGFVAALNGSIDLTTPWLMAANGLIVLLIVQCASV